MSLGRPGVRGHGYAEADCGFVSFSETELGESLISRTETLGELMKIIILTFEWCTDMP